MFLPRCARGRCAHHGRSTFETAAPSPQRLLRKAPSSTAGAISRLVAPLKLEAEQAGSWRSRASSARCITQPPFKSYLPNLRSFCSEAEHEPFPSAIKDGKIPSFMQLCLFSSLFLSLDDRVGREKERMGREAPERGKLPPDQAIEVRRERKGKNRG